MTNQERAAEVIWEEQAAGIVKPRDLVEALADAGLLMPDLPEQKRSHDDPKWQAEYQGNWGDEFGDDLTVPSVWSEVGANTTLQVFPGNDEVQPYYDGEPEEPVSVDEARQIGMKWLAAAKLAEEQE
ncbi:hypothetical protein [Corynebacterium glutamicum]|uniref:hypothetical protein n=1 Tax=Corynebacterium glutamicum TaxID=1718 RepID=UPI0002F5BB45|nr:hypothetical protein [Corynebacterium glutamicum]